MERVKSELMEQLDVNRDRLGVAAEQVVRVILGMHPKWGVPGVMLECILCGSSLVTSEELKGGITCRECKYLISAQERDDLLDRLIECLQHLKITSKAEVEAEDTTPVEKKRTSIWQSLMFWQKPKSDPPSRS